MRQRRENVGRGDARVRYLLAASMILGSFFLLSVRVGMVEVVVAGSALASALLLLRSAYSRQSLTYGLLGLDTSEYARIPPEDGPDRL